MKNTKNVLFHYSKRENGKKRLHTQQVIPYAILFRLIIECATFYKSKIQEKYFLLFKREKGKAKTLKGINLSFSYRSSVSIS